MHVYILAHQLVDAKYTNTAQYSFHVYVHFNMFIYPFMGKHFRGFEEMFLRYYTYREECKLTYSIRHPHSCLLPVVKELTSQNIYPSSFLFFCHEQIHKN